MSSLSHCPYCGSRIVFMFRSALGSNVCSCSKCPYIGAYQPGRVLTIAKGVSRHVLLARARPPLS
jgi:ribosomal protein L37AE/L43A